MHWFNGTEHKIIEKAKRSNDFFIDFESAIAYILSPKN